MSVLWESITYETDWTASLNKSYGEVLLFVIGHTPGNKRVEKIY